MANSANRRYDPGARLYPHIAPEMAVRQPGRLPPGTYVAGQLLGRYTSLTGGNEVQTLTIAGSPTGGGVVLTFDATPTSTLPYNATAAQVQAALIAHPSIGTGNVVCAGGPWPATAISVTFTGDLARVNVPAITATHTLTGGSSPTITVTETTAGITGGGGYWGIYNSAASDGTQTAQGALEFSCTVAFNGRIYTGADFGGYVLAVPIFTAGIFKAADLVGLDSSAVTALRGQFQSGNSSSLTDTRTIIRIG